MATNRIEDTSVHNVLSTSQPPWVSDVVQQISSVITSQQSQIQILQNELEDWKRKFHDLQEEKNTKSTKCSIFSFLRKIFNDNS